MKSILLCLAVLAFQGQQVGALADKSPASAAVSPQIIIEAAIYEMPLPKPKKAGRQQRAQMSAERCLKSGSLWSTNFIRETTTNTDSAQDCGFDYIAGFGNGFAPMIAALGCDHSALDLIGKPRIQTWSGVSGTLFVGDWRPYILGSFWSDATGWESNQPTKLNLALEITPSILTNGVLALEIQSEYSWIAGKTNGIGGESIPCLNPTRSRAAVTVHDGEILMIAGGTKAYRQERSSGIPILKHIPLIGYCFRGSSSGSQQNRIIVLLNTSVVPTS